MRTSLVLSWVLGLLSLGTAAPACSKKAPPDRAVAAAVSAPPVDRLEPNELAEGTQVAYGIRLPRDMSDCTHEPFKIHCVGTMPADKVANYIRKRVTGDNPEHGSAKTVFHNVTAVGVERPKPVRIEIIDLGTRTGLVFHNLLPQKLNLPESPADKMKQYGLSPDGKMLNPDSLK